MSSSKPFTTTSGGRKQQGALSNGSHGISDVLRRAVVVGGTGFLGSHIVEGLVRAGCKQIIVLINGLNQRPDVLAEVVRSGADNITIADLGHANTMDKWIPGADAVFFQADCSDYQCLAEASAAWVASIDTVIALLEACVRAENCKLVLSTISRTSPRKDSARRHEDIEVDRAIHAVMEALCKKYGRQHGVNYVALHFSSVYGRGMNNPVSKILFEWANKISAGSHPIVEGQSRRIDLLHVSDAARAAVLAAARPISGRVFSIGSGKLTSLVAVARVLAQVMHREDLEPRIWEYFGTAEVSFIPDFIVGQRALGFKPQVSLERGLMDFVRWRHEVSDKML